jgi:hypothetical protein
MFILIFIVMFGLKKGHIGVYASMWGDNFKLQNRALKGSKHISEMYTTDIPGLYSTIFLTSITSQLTSYILLIFWLICFSFGETFILILWNFSSLIDSITSNQFILIKQHIIMYTMSLTTSLLYSLNTYIYVLTISALFFLFNLTYRINYHLITYSTYTSGIYFISVTSILVFILVPIKIWMYFICFILPSYCIYLYYKNS